MPAITRITDIYSDGDTQAMGSNDVFANGLPVARLTDMTTGHGCWPPVPVVTASNSVFVNGLPAARLADAHATHCCPDKGCHDGVFVSGSNDVFVG